MDLIVERLLTAKTVKQRAWARKLLENPQTEEEEAACDEYIRVLCLQIQETWDDALTNHMP